MRQNSANSKSSNTAISPSKTASLPILGRKCPPIGLYTNSITSTIDSSCRRSATCTCTPHNTPCSAWAWTCPYSIGSIPIHSKPKPASAIPNTPAKSTQNSLRNSSITARRASSPSDLSIPIPRSLCPILPKT